MKTATFNKLREIVYQESGITLGENKMALVCARINKRIRALSLSSYEDYLKYLLSEDPEGEIIQLLDVISTNTTHFFREAVHFEFFGEQLRQWHHAGQTKFRVWCAASSSGEEPYTLAMTMQEVLGHDSRVDMKILATDISTKILKMASAGVYDEEKVKGIPNSMLKKYFSAEKSEDEKIYRVKPIIRDMISFKRLNLSTPPFPMKGPLDFVFCRNVMIYFDSLVRSRLVGGARKILRPDGFLIIGHSESLNGISDGYKPVRPSIYLKK